MRSIGRGRAIIACTAFSALLACGDSGEDGTGATGGPDSDPATSAPGSSESTEAIVGDPVALSQATGWQLDEADDDPFPEERPMWVQCEIGWEVVTGGFEVDTGLCTYAAFVQPTLTPIAEGDELELRLTIREPSAPPHGHLAVAFGSEIAFETTLPTESGRNIEAHWVATTDVSAGSPLHLHLHDDGPNTYRLASLAVSQR